MSYVSGVTLCTSCGEDDDDDGNSATWDRVTTWFVEHDLAPLARVDQHSSGTKSMQQNIGIGGYNWFPFDDFATFVMTVDWRRPELVVLVIQTEDSAKVWQPCVGKDPRPALAVRCRRCGEAARNWCYLPGSTWPLCEERGTPDPDEEEGAP